MSLKALTFQRIFFLIELHIRNQEHQLKKKNYLSYKTRFRFEPYYLPTIMLLIGIWISFTKNPMNPMIQNPIPVAIAILRNSVFGVSLASLASIFERARKESLNKTYLSFLVSHTHWSTSDYLLQNQAKDRKPYYWDLTWLCIFIIKSSNNFFSSVWSKNEWSLWLSITPALSITL